jgi:hypothetical protein
MSWGKGGIGGEETEDEDAWRAKRYHHKVCVVMRNNRLNEK